MSSFVHETRENEFQTIKLPNRLGIKSKSAEESNQVLSSKPNTIIPNGIKPQNSNFKKEISQLRYFLQQKMAYNIKISNHFNKEKYPHFNYFKRKKKYLYITEILGPKIDISTFDLPISDYKTIKQERENYCF